jgi:hypothetical protein
MILPVLSYLIHPSTTLISIDRDSKMILSSTKPIKAGFLSIDNPLIILTTMAIMPRSSSFSKSARKKLKNLKG